MASRGVKASAGEDTDVISFDMFGTPFTFKPIRLARSAKSATASRSSAASEYEHLQKQIGAFEKLTQHAISKFSSDKLHSHLSQLMQFTTRRSSIMAELHEPGDILFLNSISKLRQIVSRIKKTMKQFSSDKDSSSESESHAASSLVHYFEAFFQDVQYVRELKKYFSEKVHLALYENFYNPVDVDSPEDVIEPAEEQNSKKNDRNNQKNAGKQQEKASHLRFGLDLDRLNEKERLSYAVDAMYKLHCTWERLCIEGQLIEDDFEAESRIEMREKFGSTPSFELVLRLLPDMFVKSFKCSELAKIWLQNARSVYIDVSSPTGDLVPADEAKKRENRITSFTAQLTDLQNSHREKQVRLTQAQDELLAAQDELTKLDTRELRLDSMREQLDVHEQKIIDSQKTLHDLLGQRSQLLQELETHRGTQKQPEDEKSSNETRLYETRVAKRLKELELQLIRTEQAVRTSEYARDLLHGDYVLALEIRPNYVASRATADSRCMQLKNEADTLMKDKLVLERRLTLVRTNLDKMREIVTRFARPENVEPLEKSPMNR